MKLNCLLLVNLVSMLVGWEVSAADAPAPAAPSGAAPKIDFDSTAFNFGRLKSGDIVKHEFIFTNSGSATLQIIAVKPGCGCTTAGAWDKQVEPGKTGRIPLQYNSTGFGGQVGKPAIVTCNDPVRSNISLTIRGTVWKPIDITPAVATFNIFDDFPTNETRVLRITNNLDEAITLSDLKSSNPIFTPTFKEVKPGKEFELVVTAAPPFSNSTAFATISFKTSSTNVPMVSVSAYATVQQAVMVSPQQITLPAGPLKAPVTSLVVVRVNGTNSVELSEVALAAPGVDVKVVASQPGRLYMINLTFPVGFLAEPGQKLGLAMKSSHPRFPEIKVPVVQMQPVNAAAAPAAVGAGFGGGGTSAGPGLLQSASPIVPKPARQGSR